MIRHITSIRISIIISIILLSDVQPTETVLFGSLGNKAELTDEPFHPVSLPNRLAVTAVLTV